MHRADNLTTLMCRLSWNLGTPTSWNPQGPNRVALVFSYHLIFQDVTLHTEISLDISSDSILYTDSLVFKYRSYIQATPRNTNIMRWIVKRAFFMRGIIICERRWENIRQTRWDEVRVILQSGRWCKYENFPSTVSRDEEIWYPTVTKLYSSSSV